VVLSRIRTIRRIRTVADHPWAAPANGKWRYGGKGTSRNVPGAASGPGLKASCPTQPWSQNIQDRGNDENNDREIPRLHRSLPARKRFNPPVNLHASDHSLRDRSSTPANGVEAFGEPVFLASGLWLGVNQLSFDLVILTKKDLTSVPGLRLRIEDAPLNLRLATADLSRMNWQVGCNGKGLNLWNWR